MKKIIKYLILTVVLLLLVWPVYYFISKRNSKEITYTLQKPIKKDIKNYVVCSGIILPKQEVKIKSRVSGVLDQIYVKNGDSVYKNQVIAKIKIIPDVNKLAEAESKVNIANINFENQTATYTRNKGLFEKGIISRSEFETVETSFLKAKEELNKAQKEYRIVKSGDYSGAKNSNTSIVSTINGIVTLLPTKIGASVIQSNNFNEGTTIAKIANVDEMVFEGNVKEYEVSDLQVGMPVLIHTSVSNDDEKAVLSEISTSGKNNDGMILFEIKSKLTSSKIKKTGFSANAKIITKEHKDVLCINEEWVTFENDSSFVFVQKKDNDYEKRLVTLGLSDGVYSEVLAGIEDEEKIRVYDQ